MSCGKFIFATCQPSAQNALKAEITRHWPNFHVAFSRPGFVTLKLPDDFVVNREFDLKSVFARAQGFCLGSIIHDDQLADDSANHLESTAHEIWQLANDLDVQVIHLWQREGFREGFRERKIDQSPSPNQQSSLLTQMRESLSNTMPEKYRQQNHPPLIQQATGTGQLVLDCIAVDPGRWWIGYHWTSNVASRWVGGMADLELPEEAISRAYLKMKEAILWSRLPLQKGDHCAEIGCAPGGASQALLEQGLNVLGIDPAKVDPKLTNHPNFRHLKKRGREVRKKEFHNIRWLMADLNPSPTYTLDTLEEIVTNQHVHLSGMLITLKMLQWELAESIPEYLQRIRSWGFRHVVARQLFHNRQEICVAVLKNRSLRRLLKNQRLLKKQPHKKQSSHLKQSTKPKK